MRLMMPMPGTRLGEEKRCSSGSMGWAWVLMRRWRVEGMVLAIFKLIISLRF